MEGNYAWFIKRQILLYKSQNSWTRLLERNPKTRMHLKKNLNPTGSRLALGQKASVQCEMLASMWEKGRFEKLIKLNQGGKIVRISWICLWPSISFLFFYTFVKQILFWNCLSVNMEKCCYKSNRQTIGRIKGQGHPKQRSGKDGDSQSLKNLECLCDFLKIKIINNWKHLWNEKVCT